jgi:eukaryotic-like serine/threonine-protein kinase
MTKHKWLLIILISLILIQSGTFSAASGANTDEWTTFRHDPRHSGFTTGSGSTNSVKQLWNYSTNAAVWSSPAVSNCVILVGCKDCNIYCLNASNGEIVWNFTTGNEVNSSPAIYNGCAYVGCYDGWVYCMNISTGMPVWISKAGGLVLSSPVVVAGRVYIGSGAHDLFCFNASDGNTLWMFPTQYRVDSSPAVLDDVVYVACDDFFVYALNASTGKEIWHHHTGSNIDSPCVYNGCVYIGSYDGYVVGLNASTGDDIWKYQTQDTVTSSAAGAYGYVYIGSEDGSVYCLNASNGEKIWQTQTGYWVWSSPAVADGNVYVGSEDYNIYCLDAFTGEVKWAYATRSYVDSSPTIVNDTLYVGSHDYHVYAFTLYNSTMEPSAPTSLTAWGTFLFDDIACAVGIVVIFVIVRFVYSTKRNKKEPNPMDISDKKQSWFSEHINALCALVIVVFSVVFFVSLGSGPLWAADEKTYSQMAYHMVKSGNYMLPWSLGEPAIWAGKPPLLMWLMSLTYQVFGVNNFATRFWSPIFGVLSLVVVFYLGKKLYNANVGFLSMLVLGTFATFYSFATHAMTDGPLVFFILGSIYFVLLSEETKNTNRYAILSGLFFGLALMTKQVEALLIPLIIIIFLALTKKTIRFLFTKRFALFCGIALLVFAPYVVYMNFAFKDFWDCYFVYSTFMRTVTPLEGHAGGYLFYFNYLVTSENLLWIILLPFATGLCAFKAVIKRHKADTLILVWIAMVLGVFTFAQTKLYWYILPALPPFAIAISSFLYQISKKIQLRYHKSG